MADASVPYMNAYGNITKALERIKTGQTPPRFTQDFLETKLNLKGGSARPVIPFLKRTGFLGADGTPTELYKRFRGTTAQSGAAAAEALKTGYAPLYEVNEYVHDVNDADLKGIIVQVTGAEPASSTVQAIIGSFKALRAVADFDAPVEEEAPADEIQLGPKSREGGASGIGGSLKLGYTINLNLPATSDVAVFNAIFKSLRENLLP
jgi:hypothetical protein